MIICEWFSRWQKYKKNEIKLLKKIREKRKEEEEKKRQVGGCGLWRSVYLTVINLQMGNLHLTVWRNLSLDNLVIRGRLSHIVLFVTAGCVIEIVWRSPEGFMFVIAILRCSVALFRIICQWSASNSDGRPKAMIRYVDVDGVSTNSARPCRRADADFIFSFMAILPGLLRSLRSLRSVGALASAADSLRFSGFECVLDHLLCFDGCDSLLTPKVLELNFNQITIEILL